MNRCDLHECGRRIWFWQARFTLSSLVVPGGTEFVFHGECACKWLLKAINNHLGQFGWRKVVGWGK